MCRKYSEKIYWMLSDEALKAFGGLIVLTFIIAIGYGWLDFSERPFLLIEFFGLLCILSLIMKFLRYMLIRLFFKIGEDHEPTMMFTRMCKIVTASTITIIIILYLWIAINMGQNLQ
jgi:uncharacterized membrane protein